MDRLLDAPNRLRASEEIDVSGTVLDPLEPLDPLGHICSHMTYVKLWEHSNRTHTPCKEPILVQDSDGVDEEEHNLEEPKDSDGHCGVGVCVCVFPASGARDG